MTAPGAALYEVLNNYLRGRSLLWEQRVEPLAVATTGLQKPCLLFFKASGARENSVPERDSARFTLTVKVVAETLAAATAGQDAISLALHNGGEQDINPRLPQHPEWHILTVTETREVWIEEMFEGARRIYHAGYQYDFLMERRRA